MDMRATNTGGGESKNLAMLNRSEGEMVGKIYLLQENGSLQPMDERPYQSEDLLQTLLEKYPDLLAGEQIDELSPRKWLFISREVGVPEVENGSDRWSLDHLFLDQDAIPTLIEVKRSDYTRIRREVVGQMLDYAANSVSYWPAGVIREKFGSACESRGEEPDIRVAELLGLDPNDRDSIETFWDQVKTNLQAGKIRLVFVADIIPKELRRVVEFLNRQMDPAEVLAVEIKQYVGEGLKTLVPEVIGQIEKGQTPSENLTETEFMKNCVPELRPFFKEVLDQAGKSGLSIYWAVKSFSVRKYLPSLNRYASVIYCQPEGSFSFYFAQLPISNEVAETLRRDLLSYGLFKESGRKTLITKLNKETVGEAKEVLEFILGKVDEIAKNPSGSPSQYM
jgi:hypothetical protein